MKLYTVHLTQTPYHVWLDEPDVRKLQTAAEAATTAVRLVEVVLRNNRGGDERVGCINILHVTHIECER